MCRCVNLYKYISIDTIMNKNILFTLWVDGELDYHSKICIKSWIRLGYEVIVYKYEDIELEQEKYPLVVFKDAREFAAKDCQTMIL